MEQEHDGDPNTALLVHHNNTAGTSFRYKDQGLNTCIGHNIFAVHTRLKCWLFTPLVSESFIFQEPNTVYSCSQHAHVEGKSLQAVGIVNLGLLAMGIPSPWFCNIWQSFISSYNVKVAHGVCQLGDVVATILNVVDITSLYSLSFEWTKFISESTFKIVGILKFKTQIS